MLFLFLTTSTERETEASFCISPNFFCFKQFSIFDWGARRGVSRFGHDVVPCFLCAWKSKLQKTRWLRRGEKYLSIANLLWKFRSMIASLLLIFLTRLIFIVFSANFAAEQLRYMKVSCRSYFWSIFCFGINIRWKNRAECGYFGC